MSDRELYDAAHRAERARWQARIDAGETVRCPRCGHRVTGTRWDLGHARDRKTWSGPEHIPCNRRTRTHMAAERKRPPERHPGALT